MFLPQSALFLLAVAGVVGWILGARRVGAALVAPAIAHWVVWPIARPFAAEVPIGVWLLLAVVCLPLVPFAAVLLLQRGFLDPVYGSRTGAHVGAIYLVRILDGILAIGFALVTWPIRLISKALSRRDR